MSKPVHHHRKRIESIDLENRRLKKYLPPNLMRETLHPKTIKPEELIYSLPIGSAKVLELANDK